MLQHLAIIMDGNRRWAKKRFLPSIAWHKAWAENVKTIAQLAYDTWIKYLTLWALSTENLEKREQKEVDGIIKLINNIESYLDEMIQTGLKLETIGDLTKLPQDSQEILHKVKLRTQNNSWLVLTIALIYGWQDEILRATKQILRDGKNPETLTNQEFRSYLDSHFLPVPDVIVRTGWDIRHSGFLLYDSAYSEYYFTDKPWPEYDEAELAKTIDFFENSKRNFGK